MNSASRVSPVASLGFLSHGGIRRFSLERRTHGCSRTVTPRPTISQSHSPRDDHLPSDASCRVIASQPLRRPLATDSTLSAKSNSPDSPRMAPLRRDRGRGTPSRTRRGDLPSRMLGGGPTSNIRAHLTRSIHLAWAASHVCTIYTGSRVFGRTTGCTVYAGLPFPPSPRHGPTAARRPIRKLPPSLSSSHLRSSPFPFSPSLALLRRGSM